MKVIWQDNKMWPLNTGDHMERFDCRCKTLLGIVTNIKHIKLRYEFLYFVKGHVIIQTSLGYMKLYTRVILFNYGIQRLFFIKVCSIYFTFVIYIWIVVFV